MVGCGSQAARWVRKGGCSTDSALQWLGVTETPEVLPLQPTWPYMATLFQPHDAHLYYPPVEPWLTDGTVHGALRWFQGRHQPGLGLDVLILVTSVFHFDVDPGGPVSSVVYFTA